LEKLNNKVTFRNKILYITIISLGLGKIINIGGFSLSEIFSLLLLLYCALEIIKNKNIVFSKNTSINILIVFFLFWLLYGLLLFGFRGINQSGEQSLSILTNNIFITIMMLYSIRNLYDIRAINRAFLISIIINLGIAVWEINTGQHLGEINSIMNNEYVFGVFYNQNDFATFLFYGLVSIIINFELSPKTKANAFLHLFLLLTTGYILLKTGSRGNIFGMALLFSLTPAFIFINKIKKDTGFNGKSLDFLLVLFSVAISILLSKLLNVSLVSIDSYRVYLANTGMEYFFNSGLLGLGPGQSNYLVGGWVHNLFLEILYDYGIIIWLGFIAILWNLYSNYKSNLSILLASLISSFVLILPFVGISSSSTNKLRCTWIILMILYLLVNQKKNKDIVEEK